jgi:hypothetical protein
MAKNNVIVAASDAKYGDFLLNHWLRSLQENVNLHDIDVVVLDYGLAENHRRALKTRDVGCFPCTKDGFVGNLRFRDIARLLVDTPYDQILSVDSGDVIFQADISYLFSSDKNSFRVVREELRTPFYEIVMRRDDLSVDVLREMLVCVKDKAIINCGFVLGPARLYKDFWIKFSGCCDRLQCYGSDQLFINYLLHCDGFTALDSKYNYVLVASRNGYSIKEGVFYDTRGEVIPVVHNAGNSNFVRPVRNFGYGPGCNKRKWVSSTLVHWFIKAFQIWHYVAMISLKREGERETRP